MKPSPASACIALLLILHASLAGAQPLVGFWGVEKVTVGDRDMTPVAKWFRIEKDHSIRSGNGWLQNGAGTWTYNKKRHEFTPTDTTGIRDEYGSFKVRFGSDRMYWEREEDGMHVVVTLHPITGMPMSTADRLVGLWDMTAIIRDGVAVTYSVDPDNQIYLFIRWDRVYVGRSQEGDRSTGYWHIDGHRPEVTLIPREPGEAQTWLVTVTDSELTMQGVSESIKNTRMIYNRIHEFPK